MDKKKSKKDTNQDCVVCSFFNNKFKSLYTADECSKLDKIELNILKESSKLKNDNFEEHLNNMKEEIYAHPACVSKYDRFETVSSESNGNKRKTSDDEDAPVRRKLRSGEIELLDFDYEGSCLICAKYINPSSKNKNICKVTDIDFKEKLYKELDNSKRDNDFKEQIKKRLQVNRSLIGLAAQYHKNCFEDLKKYEPPYVETEEEIRLKIDNAMKKVFIYIDDNNDCQYTYDDFRSTVWSRENYKPSVDIVIEKLKEHYGEKNVKVSTATDYKIRIFTLRKETLFHILDSPSDYDSAKVKPYFHKNCSKMTNDKKKFYKEEKVSASKIDKSMEKLFKFIDNDDDCQYTYEDIKNEILDKDDHLPSIKVIANRLKARFNEKNVLVRRSQWDDDYYFTICEKYDLDEDKPKKKTPSKNPKKSTTKTQSTNGVTGEKDSSKDDSDIKESMQKIFNYIDNEGSRQYTFEEFKDDVLEEKDYVPKAEEVSSKLKEHYGKENVEISKKSGNNLCYNIIL